VVKSHHSFRAPPPSRSRPEAEHFPTQQYTFEDKKTFHAPQTYPEPPRDMWYNVPETKVSLEEPPKPIFPWEQDRTRPTTARVFAEDFPPSPQLNSPASPPSTSWEDSTGGMEKYMRNIMISRADKLKEEAAGTAHEPTDRRESLVFTGLPAIEDRPSLPVTPAPIATPPFWADDQADQGTSAVPEVLSTQEEWVCPNCGFLSTDPSVFITSRSSTFTGHAVLSSPALSHPKVPDEPESSQSNPITLLPAPRPTTVQRISSSEISTISAISRASTDVPSDIKPSNESTILSPNKP
jgi:glycogenin glucosyltransferase